MSSLTTVKQPSQTATIEPISPYARFATRLRHKGGHTPQDVIESEILAKDICIQRYLNKRANTRGNSGIISNNSFQTTLTAAKNFLKYINRPINDHAFKELIEYKQQNPLSTTIEQAVEDFASEPAKTTHAYHANRIIGIFRDNHAPLSCAVWNHFEPKEEDCSTEHFLDTFDAMNDEAQDAMQWSVYFPQRATACFKIPLSSFEIHGNYAIATVQSFSDEYKNKTKVKHPAIIPLAFFNKVKTRAEQANRTKPFPNYQSLFKLTISPFCRTEFNEKLVSNRGRKYFEEMADKSLMSPAIAAFLMGDKTKLKASGHIPEIYNPRIKPKQLSDIVEEYAKVEPYLNLKVRGRPTQDRELSNDEIRTEIARLTALLNTRP